MIYSFNFRHKNGDELGEGIFRIRRILGNTCIPVTLFSRLKPIPLQTE